MTEDAVPDLQAITDELRRLARAVAELAEAVQEAAHGRFGTRTDAIAARARGEANSIAERH